MLLKDRVLVKSVGFENHGYIGDPLNAVTIFNEFRADELIFLDIDATKQGRLISLDFVKSVGDEVRMPFSVGGGIRSIPDIEAIIKAGAEKVVIGTQAGLVPEFVREAAYEFGSTTIVVCIDVRSANLEGRQVFVHNGSRRTDFAPVEFARLMEDNGAGEIVVQSVERDGTMSGYDIDLIASVASCVNIPVVALGGAGSNDDLIAASRDGGASAAAAGSLFVYQGTHRGVLINYPDKSELGFE